jgi:hypothetical protein
MGGRRGRTATATATGGLVYAHTRHATSRAGDPCPHDHVLLANLVEMRDHVGGWKAADTALWRVTSTDTNGPRLSDRWWFRRIRD